MLCHYSKQYTLIVGGWTLGAEQGKGGYQKDNCFHGVDLQEGSMHTAWKWSPVPDWGLQRQNSQYALFAQIVTATWWVRVDREGN